jgi:hypothetical protein
MNKSRALCTPLQGASHTLEVASFWRHSWFLAAERVHFIPDYVNSMAYKVTALHSLQLERDGNNGL